MIIPVLGMRQAQILPGPLHWIIQALHLAVGIIAMVLAQRLAQHILQDSQPSEHERSA